MKNKVFIATSLDGYIADADGGIGFLESIPELNEIDSGWNSFMEGIDALVMGRNTFEKVISFGIDWPYQKPVFVLSSRLKEIPEKLRDQVFLSQGPLKSVLASIHQKGFKNLYIDGGSTIQSFLEEDLIDEMIITTIPVLLGGGIPLFKHLDQPLHFHCIKSVNFLDRVNQSHYQRIRK